MFLLEQLGKGARFADAIGLGEQEIEAIYTLAFEQYQQGRYADAIKHFAFIVFHDPLNIKAFKGLGSALQMSGKYQEALFYLTFAIIDDDSDLQTALQIAECLLHVQQRDDAKRLLKKIEQQIAKAGANTFTKNKVKGLLELLGESDQAASHGNDFSEDLSPVGSGNA